MLRRSPFKSKQPERRPCTQWEGPTPSPRVPALRVVDTRAQIVVPLPKGPKAKPGKRTPTKREADWMDKIVRLGCVACFIDGHAPRTTAVHHMLRGGVRMGHLFTIGLCDPGHHQGGTEFGLISRHPYKARFEERYGPESQLLAITQHEVEGMQ